MKHLRLSARPLPGALVLAVSLAACSPAPQDGITTKQGAPFAGITPEEVITLIGTEPFWSLKIKQDVAAYTTPENPGGSVFEVSRFAGNNGLGFSGKLGGAEVAITVTPGDCSDAMSDRTYPFTATVKLGEESLAGCGYTDRQGFTGEAAP